METTIRDIQSALAKSENDLLIEIGAQLETNNISDDVHAIPDFRKTLKEGSVWFNERERVLQELLCKNEEIKKISNLNQENGTLLIAIFDLISSLTLGVSPFTVTALEVKRGLDKFCAPYWNEQNK